MLHLWEKALLDGATDIFGRDGKKAPSVDEDTVRALQAKIEELTEGNDFFSRKFKPWTGR